MRVEWRPRLRLLLVGALCAAGALIWLWLRLRAEGPAELISRFPFADSILLMVDVRALRAAGILDLLAGSKAVEESDYKQFVERSGFDYRKDLDFVLASFHKEHVFMLVRGRFDWPALRAYVAGRGGVCEKGFCRLDATHPGRTISFFDLSRHTMALAVSPDPWAAGQLRSRRPERPRPLLPDQPLWLLVPSAAIQSASSVPPGTRLFAKALENSEFFSLAMGPEGERFRLLLDVTCRSPQDADLLQAQLEKVTDVLRKLISRTDQQPNPRDLSGVLTGGVFRREDRRVLGAWPVERAFLESLAEGSN